MKNAKRSLLLVAVAGLSLLAACCKKDCNPCKPKCCEQKCCGEEVKCAVVAHKECCTVRHDTGEIICPSGTFRANGNRKR